MKVGFVAVFAALWLAVASAEPLAVRPRTIKERIVGGSPVPDSNTKYDFMVSLQADGFGHYCGGSLISPTRVLTAAHCQQGYPDPDYVLIGPHQLSKPGKGQKVGVKKVIIHPKYGSNQVFDVAIIVLKQAVKGINPVALSNPSQDGGVFEKVGLTSKVIGWGALKEGGGSPDRLQQVSVPVVSYAQCTANGAYPKFDVSEKDNVCAGFKNGGKDSCQGDSGGPLFIESLANRPITQIGIVSWGEGCARKNKYGVYARVSSSLAWIKKNTPDLGSGAPAPSPVAAPVAGPPTPTLTPSPSATPDWEKYFEDMQFCKARGGKNKRKCQKLKNKCVFQARQCVTKLVKNPLYANPPGNAPTPPPTVAKPNWAYYKKEMKFCKRFSKSSKKCNGKKKRCLYENKKCVTKLVNDPLYETAAPTRAPTESPTPRSTDYYSSGNYYESDYDYSTDSYFEPDPCWDLNKKQCKQNKKCKWSNFYKYCIMD